MFACQVLSKLTTTAATTVIAVTPGKRERIDHRPLAEAPEGGSHHLRNRHSFPSKTTTTDGCADSSLRQPPTTWRDLDSRNRNWPHRRRSFVCSRFERCTLSSRSNNNDCIPLPTQQRLTKATGRWNSICMLLYH